MLDKISFVDKENSLNGLIPINKPGGMLSVSAKEDPSSVASICQKKFNSFPIHRLDKGTSGLILTGSNRKIRGKIAKLLNPTIKTEKNHIKKEYICILKGDPSFHIPNDEIIVTDNVADKYAKSVFNLLEINNGFSIFLVSIETGRTHQIRIHSKSVLPGGNVVGDTTYGGNINRYGIDANRFLLHSYQSTINRENFSTIQIKADLPDDMLQFISQRMQLKNTNFLTKI